MPGGKSRKLGGQPAKVPWRRLWASVALVLACCQLGLATPARLWLSLSGSDPYRYSMSHPPSLQPLTVQVDMFPNTQSKLYLWGQPQTVDPALPYSGSNMFRQLVSFSFNIAASSPATDVVGVNIENPSGARFDFEVDSGHPVTLTNQAGLEVTYPLLTGPGAVGLTAYSLTVEPESGIGPDCQTSVGVCVPNPAGPAWLLAEADISAMGVGTSLFHLQLGHAGLGHHDAPLQPDDRVVLGVKDGDNFYNATLDRQITLPWDSPDAIVRVLSEELLPGDYNSDGSVNAADYVVWRNYEGTMTILPNDPIGGTIGAAQYVQWLGNFHQNAAGMNILVPEPGGLTWILWWALLLFAGQRVATSQRTS